MMIAEDLDLFLRDFGVPCSAGNIDGVGILDMPTSVISGDMVLSTEYQLTVKASDFGTLGYNSQISVDGTGYQVRDLMLIDDGKIAKLSLTKIALDNGVLVGDVFVNGVFI